MDYYKHGKTPAEAISAVSSRPNVVMKVLREELTRGFHPEGYVLPDVTNSGDGCSAVFGVEGIAQAGKLNFTGISNTGINISSRFAVHWPTVLRNAIGMMNQRPSVAFMLFGFHELIRRASVVAGELLHRKYCQDIVGVNAREHGQAFITDRESLVPFTNNDRAVLFDILQALAENNLFIHTLQQAFLASYTDSTYRANNVAMQRVAGFPLSFRKHSSLFRPGRYFGSPQNRAGMPRLVAISTKTIDKRIFGPDQVGSFLQELRYILEYGTVRGASPEYRRLYGERVKELGIASISPPPFTSKKFLFVNWKLWLKARYCATTRESYIKLFPAARKNRHLMYTDDAVRAIMMETRRNYRKAYVPVTDELFTGPLREIWKEEFDRDEVSVFHERELLHIIRKLSPRTSVRGRSKPELSKRRHVASLPIVYETVIDTESGSYSFKVIQYKKKVLFVPPWMILDDELWSSIRTIRGMEVRKVVLGVYEIPSLVTPDIPGTALTLGNLWQTKFRPGDSMLYSQLQTFTHLNRQEFRAMCKQAVRQVRGHVAHDEAIIELYRPKMSKEVRIELQERCEGRAWYLISNRARILRRRLIAAGVYNIDELPHGKFNAAISKEICEAQEGVKQK